MSWELSTLYSDQHLSVAMKFSQLSGDFQKPYFAKIIIVCNFRNSGDPGS